MKPFTYTAMFLFALISLLQLLRVVMGWEVMVNGMLVPLWASGIAFVVAGTMALLLWREAHQ